MTAALRFDAEPHVYTLDDVVVPSVTGVLKDAGLIDFSAIPPSYLEAARLRGSTVHQAIHYFNENDLDLQAFCRDFPDYAPYVSAWVSFCAQRHFVPILNERRVASRRHGVAGTLDCLGTLDGVAVLLDFKTGRPSDVAADLQTAAYYALALEWASDDPALRAFFGRYPLVRRFAVQLTRTGTFHVEACPTPTDFREFLTLIEARKVVAKRRRAALAEVAA